MVKKYWRKYLVNIACILALAVIICFCAAGLIDGRNSKDKDGSGENALKTEEKTDNETEEVQEEFTDEYFDIRAGAVSGNGNISQEVKLYVSGSQCYFFMPSYCRLDNITIEYDKSIYSVWIGTQNLDSKSSIACHDNAEYDISIACNGEKKAYKLHVLRSDDLPALFISTANKTMDFINDDKTVEEPGSLLCVNSGGDIDCAGDIASIRARGKSSFYGDVQKKSYQVKLTKAQSLMAMDKAQNWVLQANAYDASRMRNKLAYDIAEQLGLRHAVHSESADVYFNGEYAGNYLICEKVEAGENRVNIPVPDFEGDKEAQEIWDYAELINEEDCRYYSFEKELDYSVGYLLELQTNVEDGKCYFRAAGGNYEIRSPKKVSRSEIDYLAGYISEIDELISKCGDMDSYNRLKKYIDIDSFAVKYMLDIITNEPDSNYRSSFYYIIPDSGGGKLYAGPVWDYDRAFGNSDEGVFTSLNCFRNGWCEELFANEAFRENVKRIFNEQLDPMFQDGASSRWFDDMQKAYRSLELDKLRWGYTGSLKEAVGGSYVTIDDNIEYLKYYCGERVNLLKDLLNNPSSISTVTFTNNKISVDGYVRNGEKIPEDMINAAKEKLGCSSWLLEGGFAYSPIRPVFSDIVLYAGYE